MISEDISYRVGVRALVYMILRKLKYPLLLVGIMIAYTLVLSFVQPTLTLWQAGPAGILKESVTILFLIQKYGWFFTSILALFFGLTAIPEYLGRSFRLDGQAFYVRSGLLTHREVAIPYRHIQTVEMVERTLPGLLGVCSLHVETSAEVNTHDGEFDAEATMPCVQKGLARSLEEELLKRSAGTVPA